MPPMRTAWSATTAAVGGKTTGNATTAITAVRARTVTVMRSITVDIAVPARKITSCATTAVTALTNAVSATKSAAAVIRQAATCATCATKNARSASILSATTAVSVPSVPVTSCTAPSVCCASAARIGYAIAARVVQTAPRAVSFAMRSAQAVPMTSFAPIAKPALNVLAARATIAPTVCYVNSVRNISVSAAGDALNASLFVSSVAKNARTVQTAAFARTAESALTAWAVMETTVQTAIFVNSV